MVLCIHLGHSHLGSVLHLQSGIFEGLTRQDIQEASPTWRAVHAGCGLAVQLVPFHVAWASHSLVAGFQEELSPEQVIPRGSSKGYF